MQSESVLCDGKWPLCLPIEASFTINEMPSKDVPLVANARNNVSRLNDELLFFQE